MKKYASILMLTFLCISLFSQDFNSPNMEWDVAYSHPDGDINHPTFVKTKTTIYGYLGDTLIDNQIWNKIYSADNQEMTENREFLGCIRQINPLVLFLNLDSDMDTIYRFDLSLNDTIIYHMAEVDLMMIVNFIDSVMVNGVYKKRFHFENETPYPPMILNQVWIEDIGSIHGPLFPSNPRVFDTEMPDLLFLTCCHMGEQLIWDNPNYDECIVNISLAEHPFITENKQWNVVIFAFGAFGVTYLTEIFHLQSAVFINGELYREIGYSTDSLANSTLQGYVREWSDQVYIKFPDSPEALLYDFSLNAGDTAQVASIPSNGEIFEVIIESVDTIEYEGMNRRRLKLQTNNMEEYWIAGIGSTCGPLYTLVHEFWICPEWSLVCAHENDTLIYIKDGETECYQVSVGLSELEDEKTQVLPNPVVSGQNIQLKSDKLIRKIQIFNAHGVLVKSIQDFSNQQTDICTIGMQEGLYLMDIEMENGFKKIMRFLVL